MASRWVVVLAFVVGASGACEQAPAERSSSSARARLDELRGRFRIAGRVAPAIALATETTLETVDPLHLRAHVAVRPRGTLKPASVVLAARADLAASVEDDATKVAARFALRFARPSVGGIAEGVVVYPEAFAGADVVHRADADGVEDFVIFEERPAVEELVYDLDVSRVAGLRLVGNTLELLDVEGTPGLRVAPPWVVDTRGERRAATLRVEGCALDRSGVPPWNRPVTAPGATTCAVHVTWTSGSYPALVDPSWTTTGSLAHARDGLSVSALPDGRALVAGGTEAGTSLATTEIYDVKTGTFASGPTMSRLRSGQSATRLPSGKILIVSGAGFPYNSEIYDPVSGAFGTPIPMPPGMGRSAGALLKNGKVLLVGPSSNPLLFDETTSTFTSAGSPSKYPGSGVRLMALASGKAVLEHGAADPRATLEIFDPATNAFSGFIEPLPYTLGPRFSLLSTDKVLVTGGYSLLPLGGSSLYDPSKGTSVASGNMVVARSGHTSTPLHNGKVLITGGDTKINAERAAEVYDIKKGTFASTSSLVITHPHPTVTVLASGKVLLLDPEKTAELYEPSRLTREGCKENADCESGFCTDGVCCTEACSSDCQACNVPGKLGTCSLVTGAPLPSRRACDGAGACAGTCDGKAAGCTYPLPATTCGSTCGANKQTTSRCNGEGACIEADATSCKNLICADAHSCKITCLTTQDCIEGFECRSGACVVGTTCVDDHTAQPIAGPAVDCSPYRCARDCVTACTSVNDCSTPNICDETGKCVSPPSSSDGGCAVARATSAEDSTWLVIACALVGAGLVRSRRRSGMAR